MTSVNMQVKVASGILRRIDRLVRKGAYMNRSDFIRAAIRRSLDENGNKG